MRTNGAYVCLRTSACLLNQSTNCPGQNKLMPQRDDELIKSLSLQRLYMRLRVQLIKDLITCMRARANQRPPNTRRNILCCLLITDVRCCC